MAQTVNKLLCQIIVLMFTAFLCATSFGLSRYHVSSDTDYFVLETPRATFIYPKEYQQLVGSLAQKSDKIRARYEKEFAWKLDQKPVYILYSSQNQISNGYATTMPEVHTGFNNLGPGLVDYMAAESWLDQLIIHETAHLYQLNIKKGYGEFIYSIFGTSNLTPTSFLPPFTYTQYSNYLLPTMFLEGNATYNEGRFGNGGRLYSGHARALLVQQLAANKVTAVEMFNDHLDFPYGGGKYILGGFLFESLASDLELKKSPNYFFNTHADHAFGALSVDAPFRKVFSQSYDLAFQNLKARWQKNVDDQLKLTNPPLFKSKISPGITFENGQLYFLTSNLKSLPTLNVWDSRTKKWKTKSVNLPTGKVLRVKGEWAVVSAANITNNKIRAGLFGEGYNLLDGTQNRYYSDIEGDRQIWFDSVNSFDKNRLHDANGLIAEVNSQAIIGTDGHTYYFKQVNKTRTLYRDSEPLFSYQGFYGFPVDGNSNGIYFIGPSENGSALFSFKDKTFYRAVQSERVIDAVVVDDSMAFVSEVTSDGYEYQFAPLQMVQASPFPYEYPWENTKLSKVSRDIEPLYSESRIAAHQKPYSKFKYWEFKGVDPVFLVGPDSRVTADLTVKFSDVLQNHELQLLGRSGSFGEHALGMKYTNSEHTLQWDILGQYTYIVDYERSVNYTNSEPEYDIVDRYDSWLATIGIKYPFFVRPQQKMAFASHFVYQDEQPHKYLNDLDQDFSFLNQIFYNYTIAPKLGFDPYRNIDIELSNQYFRTAPDWQYPRNVFGAQLTASQDIFRQTYLTAGQQIAWTDSQYRAIELKSSIGDDPVPAAHRILRNTQYSAGNYFNLQKTSVQLKQAIDWGQYFSVFPISLRRFALHADYNHYTGNTQRTGSNHHLFYEAGGGIDLDLLFIHKLPMVIGWTSYRNSSTSKTDQVTSVGMNLQF